MGCLQCDVMIDVYDVVDGLLCKLGWNFAFCRLGRGSVLCPLSVLFVCMCACFCVFVMGLGKDWPDFWCSLT